MLIMPRSSGPTVKRTPVKQVWHHHFDHHFRNLLISNSRETSKQGNLLLGNLVTRTLTSSSYSIFGLRCESNSENSVWKRKAYLVAAFSYKNGTSLATILLSKSLVPFTNGNLLPTLHRVRDITRGVMFAWVHLEYLCWTLITIKWSLQHWVRQLGTKMWPHIIHHQIFVYKSFAQLIFSNWTHMIQPEIFQFMKYYNNIL